MLTVLGRKRIEGLRGKAGSLMLSQQVASPQRGLEILMDCDHPLDGISHCPTSTSNQAGLWNYPVIPLYPCEGSWRQLCTLGCILNPYPYCPSVLHTQSDWSPPCPCFPVCASLGTSGFDYSSVVLLCGRDSFLPHFWAQLCISGSWNDTQMPTYLVQ